MAGGGWVRWAAGAQLAGAGGGSRVGGEGEEMTMGVGWEERSREVGGSGADGRGRRDGNKGEWRRKKMRVI